MTQSADKHWAGKMKDIKGDVIRRVLVHHKTQGHANWMKRSEYQAWGSVRWPRSLPPPPPPHPPLSLSCALYYGKVSIHFLQSEKNTRAASRGLDVRSSRRARLHLFLDFSLSHLFVSHSLSLSLSLFLSVWCWHRSKQEPTRQRGMKINCFRANTAACVIGPLLRFHMQSEICSFSGELAWVCLSALNTPLRHTMARLPAEGQSKPRNHRIHLALMKSAVLDYSGIVVVGHIRVLVPQSSSVLDLPFSWRYTVYQEEIWSGAGFNTNIYQLLHFSWGYLCAWTYLDLEGAALVTWSTCYRVFPHSIPACPCGEDWFVTAPRYMACVPQNIFYFAMSSISCQ